MPRQLAGQTLGAVLIVDTLEREKCLNTTSLILIKITIDGILFSGSQRDQQEEDQVTEALGFKKSPVFQSHFQN